LRHHLGREATSGSGTQSTNGDDVVLKLDGSDVELHIDTMTYRIASEYEFVHNLLNVRR